MGLNLFYKTNKKIHEVTGQTNSIGNVFPIYNHDFIYIQIDEILSDKLNLNTVGISSIFHCQKKDKIYNNNMNSHLFSSLKTLIFTH